MRKLQHPLWFIHDIHYKKNVNYNEFLENFYVFYTEIYIFRRRLREDCFIRHIALNSIVTLFVALFVGHYHYLFVMLQFHTDNIFHTSLHGSTPVIFSHLVDNWNVFSGFCVILHVDANYLRYWLIPFGNFCNFNFNLDY